MQNTNINNEINGLNKNYQKHFILKCETKKSLFVVTVYYLSLINNITFSSTTIDKC